MYPANTVINLKKDKIKGCSTSSTMIGRRGNYEEMFLVCEDGDGRIYQTRIVMDHRTAEVYDPNVYIPYEAMQAFWNEFARTELRPDIKIGDRNGSPRRDPDPLKLIGRNASGLLYMSDVAKDRNGILYGLYRAPIAKY